MLGHGDVGQRVVVRRRAGYRDGRPVYSDALGDLLAVDAAGLIVGTGKGPLRVPHADVLAAKRIPPPRLGTAALERIASRAWPAAEQDLLGGWHLRATDGRHLRGTDDWHLCATGGRHLCGTGDWTGPANSALTIGDPAVPLPDAINAVTAWYGVRGMPARCAVPLPLASAVDTALSERGWTRSVPTLVQTAPLATLAGSGSAVENLAVENSAVENSAVEDDERVGRVLLKTEPSEDWLAAAAGWRGPLPPVARGLLIGPKQVRFASGYRDGTLMGTARGALLSGILHLALIEVSAAVRRQGLATRLTRTLAAWARESGAHTAMLQVEETNVPALALFAKLGFRTHHSYVTRTQPD